MSTSMEARLAEIREMNKHRKCPYVERCNSRRCPLHGQEARAMNDLIEMVETLQSQVEAAFALDEVSMRTPIREFKNNVARTKKTETTLTNIKTRLKAFLVG